MEMNVANTGWGWYKDTAGSRGLACRTLTYPGQKLAEYSGNQRSDASFKRYLMRLGLA